MSIILENSYLRGTYLIALQESHAELLERKGFVRVNNPELIQEILEKKLNQEAPYKHDRESREKN